MAPCTPQLATSHHEAQNSRESSQALPALDPGQPQSIAARSLLHLSNSTPTHLATIRLQLACAHLPRAQIAQPKKNWTGTHRHLLHRETAACAPPPTPTNTACQTTTLQARPCLQRKDGAASAARRMLATRRSDAHRHPLPHWHRDKPCTILILRSWDVRVVV